MKVLIAASEAAPFAKTGGLADVMGSLMKELSAVKVNACLIMPLYRTVREGFGLKDTGCVITVPMGRRRLTSRIFSYRGRSFFIECDEFFDRPELYGTFRGEYEDNAKRFIFFSRAVVEACGALGLSPDVMHCNDWQTGLIPLYVKTLYKKRFRETATLFTIHNLGYQGIFPASVMTLTGLSPALFHPDIVEFYGQTNLLKAGITSADAVSTVSENYAREITTKQYGFGLEGVLKHRAGSITGILNGIDYGEWDPSSDTHLPGNYSAGDLSEKERCKAVLARRCRFKNKKAPIVGMVGRLSSQKGIELVLEDSDSLVLCGVNTVVLGKGEEPLQRGLRETAKRHPGSFSLHIDYDEAFAHLVYSGSDMLLMPSRYEPCGLAQMIALRYGTVPVARATGGLVDTIEDYDHLRGRGTGFVFSAYNSSAMVECLKRALCAYADRARWGKLITRGMRLDFTWRTSAKKYASLYRALKRGISG